MAYHEQHERKCPTCGERISATAPKCFNCGEYASVNNAVEEFAAGAQWFLIMHADNIAKPGWLQTFLDRIERASDDVGLIGSSYDSFRDHGPIHPGENDPDGLVTVQGTKEAIADTL